MTNPGPDFDRETEVAESDAAAHAPPVRGQPTLEWTDDAGSHKRVVDGPLRLGSGEGVDVLVTDPRVSRVHAELELRADGLWVKDLSSRNGTFAMGMRVGSARLPPGPSLRIGGTTLSVSEAQSTPYEVWPSHRFGSLLGQSLAMREFFSRLARVAGSEATVLIQGETGTGKELVANAIHEHSPRRTGPLVVVDCGSLPESLLESELFGHTKGAFTGAASARAGAIESAEGGTVFLDEVGEMPLAMQPKLLRVLESRTVRRLGEATMRQVNVRFVSATHRDLASMVNEGAFREDLYFRLSVVPLTVPPLRARKEDIPLLVKNFLATSGGPIASAELIGELLSRPWLGNVRELRNFVERLTVMGEREALAMTPRKQVARATEASTDPVALPTPSIERPFKEVRDEWMDHLEREYVRQLLARHGRKVAVAAVAGGLDPSYVHRLIKKHGL